MINQNPSDFLLCSSIFLLFATPALSQRQSECSDVLSEHLTNRLYEYNYSDSKYLYAEHYSSMSWSEFQDEFEAGATIPIQGVPVQGSLSRNQFESWKESVDQSINISDIQRHRHSLMLSSANDATIEAWRDCMLNGDDGGVYAYLEPVSDTVFRLRVFARPSVFNQASPTVEGDFFLDNATIENGGDYLAENAELGLQKVVTLRRVDPEEPIIFNANTSVGPIDAYSAANLPVPKWPSELIDKHRFLFNNNYGAGVWRDINSPPQEAFPIKHMAGNNANGIIISGGDDNRSLWYLNSYGGGVWRSIVDAPFDVAGLTGNNSSGPLIFGGDNNRSVAYLNSYGSQSWTVVSSPAPIEIKGIAGRNSDGPVIFGGASKTDVYYLNNYGVPSWVKVAAAPFEISGISGNNQSGPIVFGGSSDTSVAYINNYGRNEWERLPEAPEEIHFLSGNNSSGPIVTNRESQYLYTIQNYGNPQWVTRSLRDSGAEFLAGENSRGPIVGVIN